MLRFLATLLLISQLALGHSPAPVKGDEPNSLKIFVEQDRFYRVTGSEMAAAGLSLAQLDAARINLHNEGRTIPIVIEGLTPRGSFGLESAILFWGEYPRGKETRTDLFTTENTYTLLLRSPEAPRRYQTPGAPPEPLAGERFVETWTRTLHLERDSLFLYRGQLYEGLPTDRSMWRRFVAPPRGENPLVLDPIPDVAAGTQPFRIRMLFWGSSHPPQKPNHDWNIALNGGVLGRVQWDGLKHVEFESDAIAGNFRPGRTNTLRIQNNLQGNAIDAILLDWIEIEYLAAFTPVSDHLEFELPGKPGGVESVKLAQRFSGPPRVFEVGTGTELHIETNRDSATAGYGAVFRFQPSADKAHFAAVGPGGYAKPARIALGYPSALRGIKVAPEYLVVTHRDFIEGARELVLRRQSQGLSALLVDIDDVYDEYSHGRFSPEALKRFIDDLLTISAASDKGLRYVLLIGDATSDYKHAWPGSLSRTFVPTYLEGKEGDVSIFWPMYARDDYFVFGSDGMNVPKAAIGRLPCTTPEELRHYLDKIQEFETITPGDSSWIRRALLIGGEGFTQSCDDLAAKTPLKNWQIDTVYAVKGNVKGNTTLQKRIIESMNRGLGAVYYVGHGAYLRWRTGPVDINAQTDLFTKEHLAQLTNRGQYPVVFASACYSTTFDNPDILGGSESGIGVYMVHAEQKGAIAVISHTGKTSVGAPHVFAIKTMQELFSGSAPRLGDAFLAAKTEYHSHYWAGIALIGDPAISFGTRYATATSSSTKLHP